MHARRIIEVVAVIAAVAVAATSGAGCGSPGDVVDRIGALTPRVGTLVVEGCSLDATQTAALSATDGARHAVKSVILRCLALRSDGSLSPASAADRASLQAQIAALRGFGFRASLGLTIGDSATTPAAPAPASMLLADAGFRAAAAVSLAGLGVDYDGLEIALPTLLGSSRADLPDFVSRMTSVAHPAHPVAIFVPPSLSYPSDLPGGDAWSLFALARVADRLRIMTVDFSDGVGPGPTIDSGWAVDAERFAVASGGGDRIDVTVPLYGNDFGRPSTHAVSFAEAHDLATLERATPVREASGVQHFAYTDPATGDHQVWFDDAISTVRTLEAWTPDVLPAFVGITYYGLGAEDPALWPALARVAP